MDSLKKECKVGNDTESKPILVQFFKSGCIFQVTLAGKAAKEWKITYVVASFNFQFFKNKPYFYNHNRLYSAKG